ncbi:MAG: DUF1538 family protein [Arachnia sp.]
MKEIARTLTHDVVASLRDITPIILAVAFFQFFVVAEPLPNIAEIIIGMILVVFGLGLFVRGLHLALYPIGEQIAYGLARRGSVWWLVAFAFALGFSTTIAEPALIAIAGEAAAIAADGGSIPATQAAQDTYALDLRLTVALSVGIAITVGVIRIVRGWPIQRLVIVGYILVTLMTFLAPPEIVGIAYDSGGITTSTVTVPLVTALGVGLASSIRGRSPLTDGFGLIAFASLLPMVFVMAFGWLR